MELGRVEPGYFNNDEVRYWKVPIAVFEGEGNKELKVVRVYEDDGWLCVDVELPE